MEKKELEKKPVMMVLCEDTRVADLTKKRFVTLREGWNLYGSIYALIAIGFIVIYRTF